MINFRNIGPKDNESSSHMQLRTLMSSDVAEKFAHLPYSAAAACAGRNV